MTAALLVCGVVRAGHPVPGAASATDAATDDATASVRLVYAGALAAAVRDLPDDAAPSEDDASRYLDALIALLPGGPVLPLRFATLAPDEDAVRELLDGADDELVHRLDALDGLVEVRLQIDGDLDAELRALVVASPALARARPEPLDDRVRYGEQISARLAERRDELADQVLARLQPLAVAHAAIRPEAATELKHAYLIRAEALPAFDRAVQALRDDLGERYAIEYAGPLPAFEFTDLVTDLAPDAPPPARSRWGW
ncbi:MAG TPA: GvpL/GvpF family gas vesicle protein [Kofleriaceae bacterium]|nr:GvpL/GvpF family gas vesicle protein [Kofleriaceae bacterium]